MRCWCHKYTWWMFLVLLLFASSSAVAADVLRVGCPTQPRTLDPAFGINMAEYMVNGLLYDNLVLLNSDFELVPCLAVSWEASADASEWTFHLRQGVVFFDGSPFEANDVVYTFQRILDPDIGSPGRTSIGPLEKVIAVNSMTVKFVLRSPYAEFPTELTKRWGRIVPEGANDELATIPNGTGPFRLTEWIVGSHITLDANQNYWDPETPGVERITINFFPDPVAEINAFETGELDLIAEVPIDLYDQVKRVPGVQVEEIAAGSWIPMIMRTDTPPFDDPRVRLAVKYCIDRQAFVDTAMRGHGIPANDHSIPPNSPYYLNVPLRQQDYAKAAELLAEAGYPNGFEMELIAATDRPERVKLALVIQQMCAPVGIKFKVKTMSYDVYIAQVYKQGGCYIGWWGFRPTADGNLSPFFTCDGSWNEYAYCNTELDEILREAQGELDQEKRVALYHRAQQILSEDGPALIPVYTSFISAWQPYVKGYSIHPMTWFDHLRWVRIEK